MWCWLCFAALVLGWMRLAEPHLSTQRKSQTAHEVRSQIMIRITLRILELQNYQISVIEALEDRLGFPTTIHYRRVYSMCAHLSFWLQVSHRTYWQRAERRPTSSAAWIIDCVCCNISHVHYASPKYKYLCANPYEHGCCLVGVVWHFGVENIPLLSQFMWRESL